jgi:quercetin dioxygenase-like cupin family protein
MAKPPPKPQHPAVIDTVRAQMIASEEGHAIKHPTGAAMNIKVFAEETRGAYSLMETLLPGGGVIPAHIHATEDENTYIVEGELLMTIGEQTFHAKTGSFVIAPKGVVQTFRNPANTPCRFLTTFVPGGAEGFFKEVAEMIAEFAPSVPSPESIRALQRKYHLTYL